MKNEYGFIEFCKANRAKIIEAIRLSSRAISPKMNSPDYRFNINNLFCHAFSKEFSCGGEGGKLKSAYSKGHDMIFGDLIKISVKIQKEAFQKNKKSGLLGVPKQIIMKNCQGQSGTENAEKTNLDLNFLLTIQRGDSLRGSEKEKEKIGFAVISKNNLKRFLSSKGDQVFAKIKNEEYDYFSGIEDADLYSDPNRSSELNNILTDGLSKMYDSLLNA